MQELHSHLAFRVAHDGYRLRLNPSYCYRFQLFILATSRPRSSMPSAAESA